VPFFNVKGFANDFYIFHQLLRAVVFQFGVGARAACPALIKEHNAIDLGIKKAAVVFAAASARAAVNKQNGNAIRIARLIDIQFMGGFYSDLVTLVGFDLGIKSMHKLALFGSITPGLDADKGSTSPP